MKIVYVANSIIPSRTANSIHVMKMCQAFADNGHEVVLLVPDRYKEIENGVQDIYDYYGVKNNFKIEKTLYRYWKGKNLLQIVSIYYRIKQKKPDLVFGRYLPGCFFSLGIGKNVIYEAHAPYNNFSFIDKLIFKKMIKHNNFLHLVVISEALKNMYINTHIVEKDKIIVAHDASDNSDIKKTISLQNSKLKLGYFGHLYQGRGIDLILNLAIHFKQYDFHIVGGNINDITYWKERTSQI